MRARLALAGLTLVTYAPWCVSSYPVSAHAADAPAPVPVPAADTGSPIAPAAPPSDRRLEASPPVTPAAGPPARAALAPVVPAPASDVPGTAVRKFPTLREPSLLHLDQLGIALLPGVGFRIIAPYQDAIDCGRQAKRVCTGMLPFFMDVQPSFGFARHWDALIDLRFGIGSDFTHSREFAVAPGVRYWVDAELSAKFFTSIQGVFDATAQNNVKVRDNDFGVRNANGFMFEVMRNFGIYLQLGETIGFARWLRFEVDGGVGLQARMP